MKELTEQEAGRCARVCDWTYETKTPKDLRPWHDKCGFWYDANGKFYGKKLSLDPYFWFGRLWDKLESITPYSFLMLRSHNNYAIAEAMYGESFEEWGEDGHPCLALCEAIEKLTE